MCLPEEKNGSLMCGTIFKYLGIVVLVQRNKVKHTPTFICLTRAPGENRTIVKETMSILAIYDNIGFLQTKGAPLLGEAPLIGRLWYINSSRVSQVKIPSSSH